MNARIYDILMLTGIAAVTAGDYLIQGTGPALVTFGALLLSTTAFSVFMAR